MWTLVCVVAWSCVLATRGQGQFQLSFQRNDNDCGKYTIIFGTFTYDAMCQPGKVFSSGKSTCVDRGSKYDDCPTEQQNVQGITIRTYDEAVGYCQGCPTCLFPDSNNCADFYNCSKTETNGILRPFEDSCEYPALFDSKNGRCERDYTKIESSCKFEGRALKLDPCDQREKQCARAHCRPCKYRIPNCEGKSDGFNEWEGRSFTPYFARCQDGRTLESGTCANSRSGSPRIFSQKLRECVDVDAKTFFNN